MSKPKWTAERWSEQSVLATSYRRLGFREVIIVASADVDAALAEAISKRLCGVEEDIVAFIGTNEDGRAPVGSFSGRINMALLLGILRPTEAKFFHTLRKLRNIAAHRMEADYKTPAVQAALRSLVNASFGLPIASHPDNDAQSEAILTATILQTKRVTKLWLCWLLWLLQVGFLKVVAEIERIEPIKHGGIMPAAIEHAKELGWKGGEGFISVKTKA